MLHGTFEKDGQVRHAYTPADVVDLKFHGWTRVEDAPVDTSEAVAVVDSVDAPAVPARTGAGSSRDEWADYATAHNVVVADDAKRSDIIAALEAANVPTE